MSGGDADVDPDVRALLAEQTEAINDLAEALERLQEQAVTEEEVVKVTAQAVAEQFEEATRESVEEGLREVFSPAERPEPDGKMFQ